MSRGPVLLEQWVFWVFALFVGLLAVLLIQRVNTWLVLGHFSASRCERHVRCQEWRVANCTWYLFSFVFPFILGLLSGYRWFWGLLFWIIFLIIEHVLGYCCRRMWQERASRCCVDLLIGFLGYLLGLIFRHTLAWFPATPGWGVPFPSS